MCATATTEAFESAAVTREKCVARVVRGVFDRNTGGRCEACDVNTLHVKRSVEAGSQAPAELFVIIRIAAAELMIEVRRADDVKSFARSELRQHVEQRH